MLLTDLVSLIESVLPPSTAMEGDRLGLQIQSGREHVSHVLTCLEITHEVLDTAIESGCDCILTFHPLVFSPLLRVTDDTRVGQCIQRAIRADIAIVSAHTNFDAHPQGTNTMLASLLGFSIERPLVPDALLKGYGMGVVCKADSISLDELLDRVRSVCGSPLRYCVGRRAVIDRVAIVCGSGAGYLTDAMNAHADAFITADVKYHTFHDAHGRITLIDPGHYEMEQFVPDGMVKLLCASIRERSELLTFRSSGVVTNPVQYLNVR